MPQVFGHNLPVDEANQRCDPNPQLFRRYVRQMERVQHAREDVRVNVRRGDLHLVPVVDELAALEHHLHIHIMQVVQHDEIRQVPRRNRAFVVQQEVARGVVAGNLDGQNRVCAEGNRFADDVVNMPLVQQVVGVLVVGAEHAAVRILLRQQRHEGFEILRRRAVANHDELPLAQFFQCVVNGVALVVGIDAGGHVRVERLAGQPRRVAVNLLVMRL